MKILHLPFFYLCMLTSFYSMLAMEKQTATAPEKLLIEEKAQQVIALENLSKILEKSKKDMLKDQQDFSERLLKGIRTSFEKTKEEMQKDLDNFRDRMLEHMKLSEEKMLQQSEESKNKMLEQVRRSKEEMDLSFEKALHLTKK